MAELNGSPAIIAVVGAGGPTGQACVKRLLEVTNHQIRAIVRDPEKYQDVLPKDERVSIMAGDVSKAHQMRDALAGCAGVIYTASASSYWSADSVDFKGVSVVAKAAEQQGLRRMVLVSSMLVSPHNKWHPMRMILNNIRYNLMDFKYEGEQSLRSQGISYTIVRPGGLNNLPGGTQVILKGQGDKGQVSGKNKISRADVAAICVEALTNPNAHRVTVEVVTGTPLPAGRQFTHELAEMWNGLAQD